ncbi:MAG: hypothetical protein RSC59_07410 [Erysipelotrichaceae bacterium]
MSKYILRFSAFLIVDLLFLVTLLFSMFQIKNFGDLIIFLFMLILIFFCSSFLYKYYEMTILRLINAKKLGKENYNRELSLMDEETQKRKNDVNLKKMQVKQNELDIADKVAKAHKSGKPCCPKCGSEHITAGTRGFTVTTGFLGSGNVRLVCLNCGNKWKPNNLH